MFSFFNHESVIGHKKIVKIVEKKALSCNIKLCSINIPKTNHFFPWPMAWILQMPLQSVIKFLICHTIVTKNIINLASILTSRILSLWPCICTSFHNASEIINFIMWYCTNCYIKDNVLIALSYNEVRHQGQLEQCLSCSCTVEQCDAADSKAWP